MKVNLRVDSNEINVQGFYNRVWPKSHTDHTTEILKSKQNDETQRFFLLNFNLFFFKESMGDILLKLISPSLLRYKKILTCNH